MHPRRFARELKRRVSSDLKVVRGPRQARRLGLPASALMVFERDLTGYLHFVHAIVDADGHARDPHETDISFVQSLQSDHVHAGRPGWVDEIDAEAHARDDAADAALEKRIDDLFEDEVRPRVEHETRLVRSYPSAGLED